MLRSHRLTEHSGAAAGQGSAGVPQPPPWGHLLPPSLARQSPCGGRGGSGAAGAGGSGSGARRASAQPRQRRDLVSSPLIPRISPCRRHRCPPRQRAGTRRGGGHVSPRRALASRAPRSGGGTDPRLGACRVTGSAGPCVPLVWGLTARGAGVAWQLPWDLGDIGACWQQGLAPREPLPDVPLGTRLLPPALVNRMWSHPNPGVPGPRPSPATPRGSSSGAAVPLSPRPRSGTGRAR